MELNYGYWLLFSVFTRLILFNASGSPVRVTCLLFRCHFIFARCLPCELSAWRSRPQFIDEERNTAAKATCCDLREAEKRGPLPVSSEMPRVGVMLATQGKTKPVLVERDCQPQSRRDYERSYKTTPTFFPSAFVGKGKKEQNRTSSVWADVI